MMIEIDVWRIGRMTQVVVAVRVVQLRSLILLFADKREKLLGD